MLQAISTALAAIAHHLRFLSGFACCFCFFVLSPVAFPMRRRSCNVHQRENLFVSHEFDQQHTSQLDAHPRMNTLQLTFHCIPENGELARRLVALGDRVAGDGEQKELPQKSISVRG
jgi:hypothetical protein